MSNVNDLIHHVSAEDRHLILVCIARYTQDIQRACLEDQGTPAGREGTIGHDMQVRLTELADTVDRTREFILSEGKRAY